MADCQSITLREVNVMHVVERREKFKIQCHPVHGREKDPWYSLSIWLGRPQGQFERFREAKNISFLCVLDRASS